MKKKYVTPAISVKAMETEQSMMIIISGHVDDPSVADAKESSLFEEDGADDGMSQLPKGKNIWDDGQDEED